MIDEIEKISKSLEKIKIENLEDLENFKKIYLSRSGNISNLFEQIINIKKEDRRDFGKKINDLKIKAEEISVLYEEKFKKVSIEEKEKIDETLPFSLKNGSRHIIKVTIDKIKKNLVDLGFAFIEGREIEDDWHNFTALNFPKNHPARDMQDTFFVDEKWSLRSQTSSAQIHAMENLSLPIKIATSGKCFRNEDISSRSHCFFHQIEVLYIDENISFVDLKNHFSIFIKKMFGQNKKVRFRASYFPFTEPSAEVDMSCFCENQVGCSLCKYSGWVELGGAGMVNPKVLENCKIDSEKYSGFAWGFGIERMVMLLYSIKDIRIFSENDVRFLSQFVCI